MMSDFNIFSVLSLAGFLIGAGIAPAVYMERLLAPSKKRHILQGMRFLIWVADSFVISLVKILGYLSLDRMWFSAAIGMAGLISQLLIMLFLYGGKYYYRIFMFAIYALVGLVSDFILSLLYFKVSGHSYVNLYNTPETAVICILVNLFILLNCTLLALLFGRKTVKPEPSAPLFLMPVCLVICLFLVGLPEKLTGHNVVGADIYFASIGITFVIYNIIGLLLEQAQRKNADRELANLQCEIETQRLQYQAMESRRDEMAKLRHDYRNVLTTTLFLMENDETKEACRILQDMAERVNHAENSHTG